MDCDEKWGYGNRPKKNAGFILRTKAGLSHEHAQGALPPFSRLAAMPGFNASGWLVKND